MSEPLRVAMWSGPRNISTAMMRAWENRPDTDVWDEPFYAYYLTRTGIDHPMREQVIAAGISEWDQVVARILGPAPNGRSIWFQKHMTHHFLPEVDRGWLKSVINCFLIRDPREVIASYVKARDRVTLEDVGIPQQAAIFDHLGAEGDSHPVVLDARDVLRQPARMLAALCERIGVSFSERMLSWPPGPRDSDGVWAAHWYANVRRSTGFAPYTEKGLDLPSELTALVERCHPFYERLYAARLRA